MTRAGIAVSGDLSVDESVPRPGPLLWWGLGILLVSRLLIVLGLDVAPSSDAAWYYRRAIELLDTGHYAERGVPTAYWPVGYPAFLAGLMSVFGRSVLVGQLANVALSVGCALLLYRFCMQRFCDTKVAGLAVLLLALYPNHLGYAASLLSEPLFTFLLLWIAVALRPDAGFGRLVLVGILLGLASLVKAQMQLLGPVLAFLLMVPNWHLGPMTRAIGGAALVTLVMALTIAPWTLRNQAVMGKAVTVSTNGGMSLLAGNNPSVRIGMKRSYSEDDPLFDSVRFSVADQVAADQRARNAAWGWIRDNPGQFLALMPWKAWRLWAYDGESEWVFQAGYSRYDEYRPAFRTVRVANQGYYVLLLFAGLYGLAKICRWRDPSSLVTPFLLAFFTLLSMVFSGQSRYHAPLMLFVIAYAAWAIRAWTLARTEGAR